MFEPLEWTPHRRALYEAAREMGAQMRRGIPSWNFILRERLDALAMGPIVGDEAAPPRMMLTGTYTRSAAWVTPCVGGADLLPRRRDEIPLDHLVYGDGEDFYIAEDGRAFAAAQSKKAGLRR